MACRLKEMISTTTLASLASEHSVTRWGQGLLEGQYSPDLRSHDVRVMSSLCSVSRVIRHQALPCYWPPSQAPPTSVTTSSEEAGLVAMAEELDERMEAIIEANDVLLERVVGISNAKMIF